MVRTLTAFLMIAVLPATAAADDPALNKTLIATLRDIHDRGADLYNMYQDYSGAYRMYEGALLTVKPLLAGRPDVQKTIADGLAKAGTEIDTSHRAFVLHETIEKVRTELKGAPKTLGPIPNGKEPTPKTKEPAPKTKEPAPKAKEPAPKAKEPTPKAPAGGVSGKVSVQGKALEAGSILFVSLDKKAPKVVNADVKNGSYTVKELPPGKYAVAITSNKPGVVPAKFTTTDTSGLTYQGEYGKSGHFDVDLK